jgi:SSS family solute:Na+ symporter
MVVLGLAWIPFMSLISDTLYVYLQSVQAYIAPPIFAVFFLGIFFQRINATGCMAGLIGGFILGMARLVAEIFREQLDGTILHGFATLNFLYFCIVLLVASVIIVVTASLLSAPPAREKLDGLTYATIGDEDRKAVRASWTKWDVIHSCAVIGLILCVYLYFRG